MDFYSPRGSNKSNSLLTNSSSFEVRKNRRDSKDSLTQFKLNLLNKFKSSIKKIKGHEKVSEGQLVSILWANEFDTEASIKMLTNYLVRK